MWWVQTVFVSCCRAVPYCSNGRRSWSMCLCGKTGSTTNRRKTPFQHRKATMCSLKATLIWILFCPVLTSLPYFQTPSSNTLNPGGHTLGLVLTNHTAVLLRGRYDCWPITFACFLKRCRTVAALVWLVPSGHCRTWMHVWSRCSVGVFSCGELRRGREWNCWPWMTSVGCRVPLYK